jgi:hypothetical protein
MCCFLLHLVFFFDIPVNQAADGLDSNRDSLIDLLESIERCLKQVDIYTQIPPTPALDEIMFNIILGLFSTLALATKELQEGRMSESIFADTLLHSAL